MQKPDDSTIKISSKYVRAILWKLVSGLIGNLYKPLMGAAHVLDARGCRKIKAKAQIDNSANQCRCIDIRAASSVLDFLSERQSASWICFPKVDSGAKPIKIILTRFERFT